ncbi:MAG: sugar phosphate isomerase/epimerase family protein [Thermoguttaceae bacterium]
MKNKDVAAWNRRQMLSSVAKTAASGVAVAMASWKTLLGEDAALPKFKYAMCNELYGDCPFDEAFARMAQCGYTGVEIAPFTLAPHAGQISARRRADVRRLAASNGLEIVGLHLLLAKTEGFHLTAADAAVRRKTADYLGELARLCADLGGRLMMLGSPNQRNLAPGMSKAEGMRNAAEVLQAAAPALEAAEVTIALEPLPTKEANFVTTAAEGVELMELVGSPRVRLNLDCKSMSAETTPIPTLIHRYRKEMVHFHANDPNRQGPGFGKLDFVPVLKALADIHYRGWVSVEVLDDSSGAERLSRESIRYLKKCAALAAK